MRLLNCVTGFCGTKPDNFLIEEPRHRPESRLTGEKRMMKENGFSLLELMVVLGIAAILM